MNGVDEIVAVFECDDVPGFEVEVVLGCDLSSGVRAVRVLPAGEHPLVARRASYKPPSPCPLTRRALQAVPLGELERWIRAHLADIVDAVDQGVWRLDDEHPRIFATIRGHSAFKRQGRRGRADLFYAEAAAVYVAEVQVDRDQATMRAGDRLGLDATQLRSVLYQARRRALLTEAPKGRDGKPGGRAGGVLTAKARALLGGEAMS